MRTLAPVALIALTACAVGQSGVKTNYVLNSEVRATVGEPLVAERRDTPGVYAVLAFSPGSSFEAQLIYGGRVGTVVRFTYREFSNDMARPAFSQDLQYDLQQSSIIAFKSWRLEVLESSNSEIVARVLPRAGQKEGAASSQPPGRTLPKGARCSRDDLCTSGACREGACVD